MSATTSHFGAEGSPLHENSIGLDEDFLASDSNGFFGSGWEIPNTDNLNPVDAFAAPSSAWSGGNISTFGGPPGTPSHSGYNSSYHGHPYSQSAAAFPYENAAPNPRQGFPYTGSPYQNLSMYGNQQPSNAGNYPFPPNQHFSAHTISPYALQQNILQRDQLAVAGNPNAQVCSSYRIACPV